MKSPKQVVDPPANGNHAAEPLLDSINQAATRLGISRSLLYSEINRGRLHTVKVGKRRLVPREAQIKWLASLPAA
jgi:excisionase family DNA binding protein